jgi:hypothetical protein
MEPSMKTRFKIAITLFIVAGLAIVAATAVGARHWREPVVSRTDREPQRTTHSRYPPPWGVVQITGMDTSQRGMLKVSAELSAKSSTSFPEWWGVKVTTEDEAGSLLTAYEKDYVEETFIPPTNEKYKAIWSEEIALRPGRYRVYVGVKEMVQLMGEKSGPGAEAEFYAGNSTVVTVR